MESGPLWKAVSRLLVRQIKTGRYPLGASLPREVDLAEELKVSRNTVREAMRALADEGLVVRRRRAGTVVVSTGHEEPLRFNIDPFASLERRHASTHLRVLKRAVGKLPVHARGSLDGAPQVDWLRITLVRTTIAEERPLAWQEVYLHPRLHAIEPLIDCERESIFKLIEQRTGERLARIDTVIKPFQLTKPIARALKLVPGALALLVTRQIFNSRGELVEYAEGIYPGQRYQLEVAFDVRRPVTPADGERPGEHGKRS